MQKADPEDRATHPRARRKSRQTRGAAVSIKPGVERSGTPGDRVVEQSNPRSGCEHKAWGGAAAQPQEIVSLNNTTREAGVSIKPGVERQRNPRRSSF